MNRPILPHWYFKTLVTLIFATFAGIFFYSITFYIHEGGHIIIGSLVQIFHLKLPMATISNWIWFWNIIPLPQQTRMYGLGHNTLFALGGSIIILFITTIITIKLFDRRKKETWLILALPFVFFMHELTGNFLFGTDNWLGEPILQSSEHSILHFFVTATPWAIAIIAFPFIWKHSYTNKICDFLSRPPIILARRHANKK